MWRSVLILIVLLLILQCAMCNVQPARAAEPALAVNAYVRGTDLVVTVFVTAPVFVHVAVTAPPGWALDQTDIRGRVESVQTTVIRIAPGVGLGIFRVFAADARGNAARAQAYAAGATVEAAPAQRQRVVRMAVIRR